MTGPTIAYPALVHALRSIRRERGWTAEQVSLRMGRAINYVGGVECTRRSGYGGPKHGRHRRDGPSLRVVFALARGHEVSLEELGRRMDAHLARTGAAE